MALGSTAAQATTLESGPLWMADLNNNCRDRLRYRTMPTANPIASASGMLLRPFGWRIP
jgi:hypothetical protein